MTDNRDDQKAKPNWPDIIGYLLAAAILIPVGVWLKNERLFGFGDWVVSLFH